MAYTNNPKNYHADWAGRYPNKVLTDWLIAKGYRFTRMWEVPGPKDTNVTWIVGLHVGHSIVIVQTFKDGGWDAYVPATQSNSVDATIEAIAKACGLEPVAD